MLSGKGEQSKGYWIIDSWNIRSYHTQSHLRKLNLRLDRDINKVTERIRRQAGISSFLTSIIERFIFIGRNSDSFILNHLVLCCAVVSNFCNPVDCSPGEGNGNPIQCSCLENPRDGGAWWAAVYGVAQSRTRLKQLSSSSSSWL